MIRKKPYQLPVCEVLTFQLCNLLENLSYPTKIDADFAELPENEGDTWGEI